MSGGLSMPHPTTIPFRTLESLDEQRIAITGIGMMTALGPDRESTWDSIQNGRSGVVWLDEMPGLPPRYIVGAPVRWPQIDRDQPSGRLKAIRMALCTAQEAVEDSGINLEQIDPFRVGCAIAGHMGDSRGILEVILGQELEPTEAAWCDQFMPNTACSTVAEHFGLFGPRLSHSTACASGLISTLTAIRAIRNGQCDVAIAGGSEAIDPLFAAGFHNMRALAQNDEPEQACRPFDKGRNGFVMGEGAAIFVVERLSHALKRNARIYCTISPGRILGEAHHVTGLDMDTSTLRQLIRLSLKQASLNLSDIGYVNAHGTGTEQNDRAEMLGIAQEFGEHLPNLLVSANKSLIGHLVNAAGSVELAITMLALRDGFVPPTLNLTDPDPACQFDCVPLVGRDKRINHALKLSLAFGGHLVGVVVSRWNEISTGFAYPEIRRAA